MRVGLCWKGITCEVQNRMCITGLCCVCVCVCVCEKLYMCGDKRTLRSHVLKTAPIFSCFVLALWGSTAPSQTKYHCALPKLSKH